MTPEKWDKVKALFEAALSQPDETRTAFLARSGAESDVQDEVTQLLAARDEAGNFLEPLVLEFQKHSHSELRAPGSVLAGRFRIIRFLARGGMGEVYEA